MKMMLIKTMMIISMIINMMKNPMSMGIMLLIQTTIMIMIINLIANSSWFTMITFLMMIGGLLILFTYMSSIASNEKFKININTSIVLIIMLIMTDEMMMEMQIDENQNIMNMNYMDFSLSKMYNEKSMLMTIFLVLYLLLTMISVNKIVKHFKGPLRSFSNYE